MSERLDTQSRSRIAYPILSSLAHNTLPEIQIKIHRCIVAGLDPKNNYVRLRKHVVMSGKLNVLRTKQDLHRGEGTWVVDAEFKRR